MNHLISIVLIALLGGIVLLVLYVIRRGINGVIDRVHYSSKQYLDTQGRFRLADRYSESPETLKTSPQAVPTVRKSAPAQQVVPAALDADEWALEEESAADGEWELEEEPASNAEWELEEEAPSAPAPQPTARPTPQTAPAPAPQRAVETAKAETSRQTAPAPEVPLPVFDVPQTIPPFQETRCCICNGELGGKYAVLFRADSGAEARIDYGCALKLNCMLQGSDRHEIARAGSYMMSRYQAVDPRVLAFLKRYVQTAADRLRQGAGQ